MITSEIGSKLPNIDNGSKRFKLESKGQSVRFRFASGQLAYVAKHFIQDSSGGYEVTECPRIMKNEECILCDKFFDAKNRLKDDENNKEANSEIRKYKPALEFYYYIIDREDQQLKILQTTLGVRIKVDKQADQLAEMDSSIFSFDYILTRTEEAGSNYYQLERVDSSLASDLTKEEKEKMKEAKESDLISEVTGKGSSKSLDEDVSFEDIDGLEEIPG